MSDPSSKSDKTWHFSPDHGQLCQVIKTRTLWGETTCRVWLPGRDTVVRVPAAGPASLEDSGAGSADGIAHVALAARRKIIERIGLPQARDYRLNLLRQEERSWNEKLKGKAQVHPEMALLLVVRVEGGAHEQLA